MKQTSLINLRPGEEAEIISIFGGQMATKRLADLGLTPGTQIKLLRKAHLWGPV